VRTQRAQCTHREANERGVDAVQRACISVRCIVLRRRAHVPLNSRNVHFVTFTVPDISTPSSVRAVMTLTGPCRISFRCGSMSFMCGGSSPLIFDDTSSSLCMFSADRLPSLTISATLLIFASASAIVHEAGSLAGQCLESSFSSSTYRGKRCTGWMRRSIGERFCCSRGADAEAGEGEGDAAREASGDPRRMREGLDVAGGVELSIAAAGALVALGIRMNSCT
jgi:hypothetical protein